MPINNRHRLVVGVDFGTTYSRLAYVHTNEPDLKNIEVIKTWPGCGNANHDKAPTEISYKGEGSGWGYQIPNKAKRYGYFKLLLDTNATTTQYDNLRLAGTLASHALMPVSAGKPALVLTADYLRHLYEHLMGTLRRRLVVTLDSTPIQFVLTTPAIWSHEAQDATFKAAEMAGFTSRPGDTLSMVSEPEAAASYCIKEMFAQRKGTDRPLKCGERIVICDAGGGTVDLITYTVEQVAPALRLGEAVVGSGGKCGSVALDKEFLKLVENRVGGAFKEWGASRTGRGSTLMKAFDAAKRAFGSSTSTESCSMPLGYVEDDSANGIEDGEMELTFKDMKDIFDPVVSQVIALISQQVEDSNKLAQQNKISTILLVGGFGESGYLFKKVEEWARAQPHSIQVINPSFSWSAVVRGAVLYGVDSIVHTRKLKQHYGINIGTPFINGIHDEEDAYIHSFYGTKFTRDNVAWFAAKGDDASVEKVISLPYNKSWQSGEEKLMILTLLGCKLDDAPRSLKHYMIHILGKITCDLTSMPAAGFKTGIDMYSPFDRNVATSCSLRVDVRVGSADLEVDVMYGERSYGKGTISYE